MTVCLGLCTIPATRVPPSHDEPLAPRKGMLEAHETPLPPDWPPFCIMWSYRKYIPCTSTLNAEVQDFSWCQIYCLLWSGLLSIWQPPLSPEMTRLASVRQLMFLHKRLVSSKNGDILATQHTWGLNQYWPGLTPCLWRRPLRHLIACHSLGDRALPKILKYLNSS